MNLVLRKDVGFAVLKQSIYLGKSENVDKWCTFLNSVYPSEEGSCLSCEEKLDQLFFFTVWMKAAKNSLRCHICVVQFLKCDPIYQYRHKTKLNLWPRG